MKKYLPKTSIGPYNTYFIKEIQPKLRSDGRKERQGLFKCSFCGKEFIANVGDIGYGKQKGCGCVKGSNKHFINIANQKFGKITALEPTNKRAENGTII